VTTARTLELRRTTAWAPAQWAALPAFVPFRTLLARVLLAEAFPTVEAMDAAFGGAASVRFEPQQHVPRRKRQPVAREPYDAAILQGRVPTREGSYHDLMNALVWALYPHAKRAVHHLQHTLIERARAQGLVGRRLPEHDALAILDEGGVLVLSEAPLLDHDALATALLNGTATWRVFGHGILESLALGSPKPMMGAVLLTLPVGATDAEVDRALAELIVRGALPKSTRELFRFASEHIWP
jgi:hypothetical protein